MPYSSRQELPESAKKLPAHGQDIWRAAFNAAMKQYDDEEKAFAVAWSAAKRKFKQTKDGWVAKSDDAPDESEVYTSILKQEAPLRYTLGIVYEPLVEDSQGDFAKADTIRKAAWQFMQALQGRSALTKWASTLLKAITTALETNTPIRLDVTDCAAEITKAFQGLGDQHASWDPAYGEIVECYVMPCDATVGEEVIKEGTWLLGVVWSPDYFEKILAGERTGYSMGGRGIRQWVEDIAHAA